MPSGVLWHSPDGSATNPDSSTPHYAPANPSQLRRCLLQPHNQSEHAALSAGSLAANPAHRTWCGRSQPSQSDQSAASALLPADTQSRRERASRRRGTGSLSRTQQPYQVHPGHIGTLQRPARVSDSPNTRCGIALLGRGAHQLQQASSDRTSSPRSLFYMCTAPSGRVGSGRSVGRCGVPLKQCKHTERSTWVDPCGPRT